MHRAGGPARASVRRQMTLARGSGVQGRRDRGRRQTGRIDLGAAGQLVGLEPVEPLVDSGAGLGRQLDHRQIATHAPDCRACAAEIELLDMRQQIGLGDQCLIAGILFLVVLYSQHYIRHAGHENRYYFFVFLMTGSMLGLATAHEFGNFYVFWELMTWTSYFLVIHEQTQKAQRAGLVYFLMCAAGAYIMHFGILLLHAQTGSFEFGVIAAQIDRIEPAIGASAALCFFIGFAVKAGLVPLHSWLPLAHPEAPASISGPLSGILTKAGLFGLVKVLYLIFGAGALARFAANGSDIGLLSTLLGCATLLYGEVMALVQTEIKRMLAYSTLAQVGEIAAVLGLGTSLASSAALLHVTNHAVMKTLLFFAAGAFILQSGKRNLSDLAGLGRKMPFTAGCYALATVAIMDLPPFSGFISKFLMIVAAVNAGEVPVAALLLLGSVIAACAWCGCCSSILIPGRKRCRRRPGACWPPWACWRRPSSPAGCCPACSATRYARSATPWRCAARCPA